MPQENRHDLQAGCATVSSEVKRLKISVLLSIILVCVFPAFAFAVVKPNFTEVIYDTTEYDSGMSDEMHTSRIVSVMTDSGVVQMELEEYVCGVVLAEMPAEFESEALKAQAVVARTYTCRKLAEPKHSLANVCTDPACCQAYSTGDRYLDSGGTEELLEKVYLAVQKTRDEVLLHDGKLIEATYFSCSGGRTEDAQAVWGADIPYLQSVESPGEEQATHYTDSVTVTAPDFCANLGLEISELQKFGIGKITYTDGGGVSTIAIGGITFSGTRVRQLLGLKSTAFVITWTGESVTITTKGFGHRVGMSQYGAEAMALQGEDYKSILSHYYQGTVLADDFG